MGDENQLLDDFIRHLVDENILPYYDDKSVYIPATIYNKKVVFNILYSMGFTIDSGVLHIADRIIIVSFSNARQNINDADEAQTQIGIVNKNKISDLSPDQDVELVNMSVQTGSRLPITCFIMNKDFQVLSQVNNETGLIFSNHAYEAISFFKSMAYKLIRREAYKECFIIEIQSKSPKDEMRDKVLSFLIAGNWQVKSKKYS